MPNTTRRPCILIVDDEEGPRQSLKVVFSKTCDVHLARNGIEALDVAAKTPVEVAILDIRMPGMSGTELLAKLKALSPATEVIMLTAYETLDTAREALRHGAFEYLNKPFEVATLRDIVDRALARHRKNLEASQSLEQIATLRNDLESLRLQQEIGKDKDMIYASILHDINGPLSIISGFAQIIQNSLAKAGSSLANDQIDRFRGNIDTINEQANRCMEISRRYLGFLRNEQSQAGDVDLAQVLGDIEELLRKHKSMRDNQLIVDKGKPGIRPTVVGTDLIQMLLNLTINALQATPDKHTVRLYAQPLPKPLDVAAYPDGPSQRLINREHFANSAPLVAITVEDDGPGIPPPTFAKIFDAYFTTKEKNEGTGLGLSIVSQLVTRAKGAMLAETEPGQGTRFTIFLQAAIEPEAAEPPAPTAH